VEDGKFRVVFIGSGLACEAASMRYRAHNIIEALALAGVEGLFVPQAEIPANISTILAHDLIVLVRVMSDPNTTELIVAARRLGLPVVYDIDDYLFDPWIMPYVEAFRSSRPVDALRILDAMGTCLHHCDYFTGSTAYLAEKVAEQGKTSFVLHNGLNARQIELSRHALEQRAGPPRDPFTRIGYFSGTRTHQADFRLVYPSLMRLLREEPQARLLIVGDLDIGEFPGLAPCLEQIEMVPMQPWTELPKLIARVDMNLIPLELTPFNEGKSNLKYYEAGLVKVPSIASPTRIHRENITHGHNGLLAHMPDEWYAGLKELVGNLARRAQLGQNAFEHVQTHYTPASTERQAVDIYRQILDIHRAARGKAELDRTRTPYAA
jgi:glycosyltransferase involved in cell wall biosynthesis